MVDVIEAFGRLGLFVDLLLVLLTGCLFRCICLIVSRLYRTAMVLSRGWPPAHLDADGDWKPAPEKENDA